MVLGVAGNKSDLYEEEAVKENEARDFANQIGAIFGLTSAQNNTGIAELFSDVGNRYLDPSFQQKLEGEKQEKKADKRQTLSVEKTNEAKQEKKKKGGFC